MWKYNSSPEYAKSFSVDIFACFENPAEYPIIGEVKSREVKKFSKEEVLEFERKFAGVKELENYRAYGGIYFFPQWIYKRSGRILQNKGDCLQ